MSTRRDAGKVVLPLREETFAVGRRPVEGDRVRIDKIVHERREHVREMLARENVAIERVPVGTIVSEAPPVREEGDVLVIPLLEEVAVVERRLLLREEVRIQKVRTTREHDEAVTLRAEDVNVSRKPPKRTNDSSRGSPRQDPVSRTSRTTPRSSRKERS